MLLIISVLCVYLQVMEDSRLAGGNYTGKEERISILVKYDKVKTDNCISSSVPKLIACVLY